MSAEKLADSLLDVESKGGRASTDFIQPMSRTIERALVTLTPHGEPVQAPSAGALGLS